MFTTLQSKTHKVCPAYPFIRSFIGVITPCITGRGPSCTIHWVFGAPVTPPPVSRVSAAAVEEWAQERAPLAQHWPGLYRSFFGDRGMKIHPWKLTCPLKRDYLNRKCIFQPLIFRGHVGFRGSNFPFPKMGYVSFLEGTISKKDFCCCSKYAPWNTQIHLKKSKGWKMHYLFGGNFGGERLVSGSVHKVSGFTSSIAILFEAKKCITVKLKARCLSDTWTW